MLSRRGFLKLVTAAGASVALPIPFTTAPQAAEMLASGVGHLGLIREIVSLDFTNSRYVCRFDILVGECLDGELSAPGDMQFGVDCMLPLKYQKDDLDNCREVAILCLENELKHRGKSWNDLKPMKGGI